MDAMDWILLDRYLTGECTPDERVRVEQWLAGSPRHRELLDAMGDVATQSQAEVSAAHEAELAAALWTKIGASPSAPLGPVRTPAGVRGTPGRTRSWWQLAAAIVVVVGAAMTGRALW